MRSGEVDMEIHPKGTLDLTSRRHYVGIFLLSLATLLLELSLTRVLAVASWHHFGFLVISTALLGFGASGVVLTLWTWLRERTPLALRSLWQCSVSHSGVVTILSFWLMQQVPFDPLQNLCGSSAVPLHPPLLRYFVGTLFLCWASNRSSVHAVLGASQPAICGRFAGSWSGLCGHRRGDACLWRLGVGVDRRRAGNACRHSFRLFSGPPRRSVRRNVGRPDVCCRAGRRPGTTDLGDT